MHELPVDQLVLLARSWIKEQRDRYRGGALALPDEVRSKLAQYFTGSTLDAAGFVAVDQIENPPFYAELASYPVKLIDFREMSGVTYIDTVLLSRSRSPQSEPDVLSLIFHELVHVAQYLHLGLDKFASVRHGVGQQRLSV